MVWSATYHFVNNFIFVQIRERIGKESKMEMTYDGALVMPKSFAIVDEDEMTYVEGGAEWSGARFVRNLAGFVGLVGGLGYFLDKICPDWELLAWYGFGVVCEKISGFMVSIGIKVATVNAVAGALLLVGGIAAVIAFGKAEIF